MVRGEIPRQACFGLAHETPACCFSEKKMPQDLDENVPSFTARREAQKEFAFVTRLYPAHGGRDPVGDATAAQAAHEGSTEVLNACIADLRADLESLQRLYARAIDAQVNLEKTLDVVRVESTRQVEEIRYLKKNRDTWRIEAEAAWERENGDA